MTQTAATISFAEKARAAWGERAVPDWVMALADACDRDGQRQVARRLDRSAALISNVLRRRYGVDGHPGDLYAVEQLVRGALLDVRVACPVLGDIPLDQCMAERARPYAPTSSLRARLYRACSTCPNNQRQGGVR